MDHMGLGFRPLERMTQKRDKRVLFAAMLVTVPCPAIFLFCNGLLSVSALGLGLVSFTAIAFRDPVALVFAIAAVLYGAVYGLSLYWLAGLLSRRLASFRVLDDWPGRALLLAVPLILTILPVYSFDCMNGASSRWCNWYELHGGWFGVTETCGDFRRYGLGSD
jgi:hypothetical protein